MTKRPLCHRFITNLVPVYIRYSGIHSFAHRTFFRPAGKDTVSAESHFVKLCAATHSEQGKCSQFDVDDAYAELELQEDVIAIVECALARTVR